MYFQREVRCFSAVNHSEYKVETLGSTAGFQNMFYMQRSYGKIYSVYEIPDIEPPVHPNCRCEIQNMEAVLAGQATKDGENGADWWIKNIGKLPNYYISEKDLTNLGWRWGKAPAIFAPGKMFTRGIYYNSDGHLPQSSCRIWQEADINYWAPFALVK